MVLRTVEDRVRPRVADRAMGPSDRGGRPGCRRTAPRRTRGLRARGRNRVRAAGFRSSLVGRCSAVGSSAVGVLRFFSWDPRNCTCARSVPLRGLCVVGLVLSANAYPYGQIEPARRNEGTGVSREVGGRRREGHETGPSSASRRYLRQGRGPRAREGEPALEGQDPSSSSTLVVLRACREGRLDAEASSSQGCTRKRGALTKRFQGSRRGTGRVCEPDDASRADWHDDTGRAARASGRGLGRLLRRAKRRTKRARRLTAPGRFSTSCSVGVSTPTTRRERRRR